MHARDVGDRDLLRADRLAFPFVRAAPEPFQIGLFHHRHYALTPLDLAKAGKHKEVIDYLSNLPIKP